MITIGPHHDGSERYVSTPHPQLGDNVTVWLRVPTADRAERVWLRSTADGEPRWAEATIDRQTEFETWWKADLAVINPVTRYRFLLDGGPKGYRFVNAAGTFPRDVTDAADFWLTTSASPPSWLDEAIVYQIFPDRFASSGAPRHWPSWAVPAAWDDPVDPAWQVSTRQMFGGDLPGITAHLDHIIALGASAIYLTPFFPGHSSHRYNAQAFDRVDPLLGGNAAMIELVEAAHRAGVRVIGDLTTNHTGDTHDWFRNAQADRSSTEAEFYFFDGDDAEDYVGWFGVKTLPKLDHRAGALRQRMLVGADSITGMWLQSPYSLDGWRIDVANMTGRHGAIDTNHLVATSMRETMAELRPDAWLVAEHCYDASSDLRGDGWHGTMNYAGFTRPAWSWLADPAAGVRLMGYPNAQPTITGDAAAATMSDFVAAMPWSATRSSMTLLGSHDTGRWRTAAGDADRQLAGAGLLAGYPGVPMIYYGDEIGLTGADSDLGRVPMPWDQQRWDQPTLDGYRSLLAVRRNAPALQRGGLRWLHADAHSMTFARETSDDAVVVHVARDAHPPLTVDLAAAGLSGSTTLLAGSTGDGGVFSADRPGTTMIRITQPKEHR